MLVSYDRCDLLLYDDLVHFIKQIAWSVTVRAV
jgi:hypothetical protein